MMSSSEENATSSICMCQTELNLPNIAKLYKRIGTLEGGMDELRSLHAMVVFFSKRIRQPERWTMIFDESEHKLIGWDKSFRGYFGTTAACKDWFVYYTANVLDKDTSCIKVSDKMQLLKQTSIWRAKWFTQHEYVPLSAACLVKIFEATNVDKTKMLPDAIYNKAEPVLTHDRRFWRQTLSLDTYYKLLCPNARFYSKNHAYEACEVTRVERGLGVCISQPDSNENQLGWNHPKKYYSSSESNDDRPRPVLKRKQRRKRKVGISYRKHLLRNGQKSPTKLVPSISGPGPENDRDLIVMQDQSSSSRIDNGDSVSAESINQSHDGISSLTPNQEIISNKSSADTSAMTIYSEATQQPQPIPVIVSIREPKRKKVSRKN